ncbi:hypothetical protein WMY93_010896 [Mugilogobius chulae]|uniref:HMG box domain-containing protein n=1 Tax=Mugilogobius chulae TaxID=88201 RepID=A0AAW0P8L4_9GOBI
MANPAKWSTDNVRTLLDAMKKSVSSRERDKIWSVGLKSLDWNKVAFAAFTPEECNAKWQEIMQKLRKIKSITELIVDVQNSIDDKHSHLKFEPAKIEFPKKPVSANALYFAENKEIFKKKKPGMSSRELMKFANDSYKQLSPEKKEIYLQKVQKAKDEYQESVRKLRIQHTEVFKRKNAKTDTAPCIREYKGPKLPLNGYQLFCHEQKSRLTGIPQKKITTIWSKRWNELSTAEKNKYNRRCVQIREEAERNDVDFKQQFDKKQRKRRTFPGEPKMPARSCSALYCKNQMAKTKGDSKKRFATASQQSKNLSKQEKEKYQAIINQNIIRYKEQLQKWFETLTSTQQQEYCKQNPSKVKYLLNKKQMRTLHRTSDSEDEELEDTIGSYSDSDSDLTIIEVGKIFYYKCIIITNDIKSFDAKLIY